MLRTVEFFSSHILALYITALDLIGILRVITHFDTRAPKKTLLIVLQLSNFVQVNGILILILQSMILSE